MGVTANPMKTQPLPSPLCEFPSQFTAPALHAGPATAIARTTANFSGPMRRSTLLRISLKMSVSRRTLGKGSPQRLLGAVLHRSFHDLIDECRGVSKHAEQGDTRRAGRFAPCQKIPHQVFNRTTAHFGQRSQPARGPFIELDLDANHA